MVESTNCSVSVFSSRICEYGTQGCDVKHAFLEKAEPYQGDPGDENDYGRFSDEGGN